MNGMMVGCAFVAASLLTVAAEKPKTHDVRESPGRRVTISTKKQGKYEPGAAKSYAVIYLKVENLGDAALEYDLSRAYLRAADGKSLRWLSPAESIMLMQSSNLFFRSMSKEVMRDNAIFLEFEQKQKSVEGPVGPKTWREGLLFFEGTGKAGTQQQPVYLSLPGLVDVEIQVNW